MANKRPISGAPAVLKSKTPWREFVSRLHDGAAQEASRFYAENRQAVNASKPTAYDLIREN